MSASAPLQHGESSDAIEKEMNDDKMLVMSTIELRRRIKKQLDTLQPERLQSVADYVSFLRRKPTNKEAKLARFRASLVKAEKDLAEGRFVSWDNLQRKSKHASRNSRR